MNTKTSKLTLALITAAATLFATGIVAKAESYTVKAGDTLSSIAEEKSTTVDHLVKLNKIANPDHIVAGQILELDGTVESKEVTSEPSAQPAAAPTEAYVNAVEYYNYPVYTTSTTSSNVVLSNGNTAGETGSYAAARMAELTGVSASTWENIIARESNGQVNAYNPSGASGLFQTMPGWGSTVTVEDQIQSAYNAYNAQGLSAWGY